MKLSIIVPVYNVEKYLEDCLNSLLKIKHIDYEVILVDDGSTDSSGKICDRYVENNENFCVYHLENAGVSNARNFGIDKAVGDYYTFVDSDDYVNENVFKIMCDASECGAIDIVQCNFVRVYNNNEEVIGVKETQLIDGGECAIDSLFEPNKIVANSVWGKIYKRTVFSAIRFDEKIRIGEDLKYNFDCLSIANHIKVIPFEGYYYIKRDNSAMVASFSDKNLDDLEVSIYMAERCCYEKIVPKILNRYLELMINMLYENEKKPSKNNKKYNEIKVYLITKINEASTTKYTRIKYKILKTLIKYLPGSVLKFFGFYGIIKSKS